MWFISKQSKLELTFGTFGFKMAHDIFSRLNTKVLVVATIAICITFLYLQGRKKEIKKESVETIRLSFIPKTEVLNCDTFFVNSDVDDFNFTEAYFKDLPAFLEEIKKLTGGQFSGDGHAAMFPAQHKTLQYLATRDFVNSICETGFNYGHSSFAFATAKPDSKILSFDIGHHPYTKPMMDYLSKTYPNRFTTIIGDSSKTLPSFVRNQPSYKCNMFFVDGSHTYEVGYSDLKNFRQLAEKENIVVFDDFPTKDNAFVQKLGKAWDQAKSEKFLKEIMRCTRSSDVIRGFSIGKFI